MAVVIRDAVLDTIARALSGAPPTTQRAVREALKLAEAYIQGVPAAAEHTLPVAATDPVSATPAPPGLLAECAGILEDALNLRVGVMDSDSKRDGIEAQRRAAMLEVASRLRAEGRPAA